MGSGIGQAFAAIANTVAQEASAGKKDAVAKKSRDKAASLEAQANALRPENPYNDPAYLQKAFLAAAGLPGFDQYAEGFGQDEANAVAKAAKMTNSGGGLLNFLAASEAQKNKSITGLNTQNAGYIEGKKVDLANTFETEKTNFDQIAREEKSKLNYAATTYENQALQYENAADEQRTGAFVGLVSSGSQIAGGMSGAGGGQTPTFGGGSKGTSGDPTSMEQFQWLMEGLKATSK